MIKLFACGDVVNSTAKKDFVNSKLCEIIQSADIAICNFEAPIFHTAMKAINKAGPHVYQSKEAIGYLKDAGFNLVSLANNHIYDYGQKGMEATIAEFSHHHIDCVGGGINFEAAYQAKIIEKDGAKIAILAACENEFGCLYEKQNRGGYAWLFHPLIEDRIKALKDDCDFIVLIAHAGIEDIDIPIREWRDRYQRLCELGVHAVIGHHPHVPQGYEKHNNSWIFYSLGNFYFDTPAFHAHSDDSYSVALTFEKNKALTFEIIYHKKIAGQTCLVKKNEVCFDIEYLCAILAKGYEQRNNEISIKLFHQYYYSYYEIALGIIPKNAPLLHKIKSLIRKMVLAKKDINSRNLMLLHNLRIDSHRFLVQRALSLMSEDLK